MILKQHLPVIFRLFIYSLYVHGFYSISFGNFIYFLFLSHSHIKENSEDKNTKFNYNDHITLIAQSKSLQQNNYAK